MSAKDEYNAICAMVAGCTLDGVALAWKYACENGVDTAEEQGRGLNHKARLEMEMQFSIDSLPTALEAAYGGRWSDGALSKSHRERAIQWWRNRGYSY